MAASRHRLRPNSLPPPSVRSHRCRAARLIALAATATIAASAAAASPAAAQSNGERIANDAYSRSHDYDLIHQRIALTDFRWDSASFRGRVTTTLISRRPGLDSVVLDAGHLLTIRRATDAAGRRLRTTATGDTLVVHLARPVSFGGTVRFTLDYAGRVHNGRGLTFIDADGRPHRPRQIWSQGEAQNNHEWFPTYDFPNDKMTWEVDATVPHGFTAVSNGRLLSDRRNRDGTRTMRWSQDRPASTYLVSLIVAPLARVHESWHGIPVDYYVYRADSARARAVFHETVNMIDVYSRLTGVPYPWRKYAQTTVADFFGGMENVSATTLVDWLPDAHAMQDRPWFDYILIPHELSHQWFGDYVTTANWANTWLNEGFAEFMPGAYWTAVDGRQAGDDYYADEYASFQRIDARKRMPLASLGSDNIYPKGALVLRMLERYLGPQRFWASIHTYLVRHRFGTATSDDLRQAVLAATGQNLDWFWNEWVYQAGYPAIAVAATYDSTAHHLTLAVRQAQSDTSHADSIGLRYTTPRVFRMPVRIRVGTAKGDVTMRAWLDARRQTITVPGVGSAPTMVIFDDGTRVLKRLTFPEPTTWLATQLRRDPDLWDRGWVIGQLATRPADSLAARALASAATGADHPRTRAEAATALATFPESVATPALAAAMRDSSSRVRAAAVVALGHVGGAEAVQLAQRAFTSDSSDVVRAAAVGAIARADSAGRAACFTAALASTSYRDVIRNSALRAIGQTHDTTFAAPLAAMLGSGQGVAFTLGTLAEGGDSTALVTLRTALDDQRPYVRRWALEAIVRRAGPAARTMLEAALASLRYADTRTAAAAILKAPSGQ